MTEAVVQAAKADRSSNVASSTPDTMDWDSKARRMVMIYLPLSCFVLILLFPFYWMTITSFKPNAELLNYKQHNPFWITSPTLAHIKHLLFNTAYPHWLMTTMSVAVGATFISIFSSRWRPTRSNGCASAAAPMSGSGFIWLIWCRRRSCSFRWRRWWFSSGCSTVRWR